MACLHSERIYHRDLKLENVLVANAVTKEININDFGHSRLCGDGESRLSSKGYGTVAYMAPEMFSESEELKYSGAAVDVWSLGVMLFVMVAERYPFGAECGPGSVPVHVIRRRICNANPKPNHDFSFEPRVKFDADLRDIICGMLTVDATQRLTVEQISAHPWVAAAAPRPEVAEPQSPLRPLQLEAERNGEATGLTGADSNFSFSESPQRSKDADFSSDFDLEEPEGAASFGGAAFPA